MKTYVHLWQYLAEFFLEWEMFQERVVYKFKTHILCSITAPTPRKSFCLWDDEKYGTTGKGACALHDGYLRLQAHTQNM
jgi:hypothetical protein